MTGPRRAAVMTTALLTVVPLVLAGCSGAGGPPARDVDGAAGGSRCLPSRITAEPTSVAAGQQVRLLAPPFACSAGYPSGTTYRLLAWADLEGPVPSGGRDPRSLGTVPVEQDGSLDADVTLPTDLPPGRASIQVLGSAYDDPCDDTGGSSGSCALYDVDVEVLPVAP